MLLSRETSGSVASIIVQNCAASSSYGMKAESKSSFKDARDKVNYLRFSNYTSNTLHKPKMSRIPLEVILPVFLVLKFDYKYVGDTILPRKVSVLRDSTPFASFEQNTIIPASLRGCYLTRQ
jgi:hypothetical protein